MATSLQNMCMICHVHPPVYTCPRCQRRTCSLTCYKRHQARAQCSGKRDPAAYLKRSQLATPAGLDHDYNFLTGIEQAFDAADRDAEHRGISLDPRQRRDVAPQSNFERRLQETKVVIERAPAGMARQRENRTRWHHKHKCIMWTVEWIHPSRRKQISSCRDDSLLTNCYATLMQQDQQAKRRKIDMVANDGEAAARENGSKSAPDDASQDKEQAEAQSLTSTPSSPSTKRPGSAADFYFYLVRPRVASASTVLVPVSAEDSLFKSLAQQTVLEFPTIQVLHEPPDNLPAGLLLEQDYLRGAKLDARQARESSISMQGAQPEHTPRLIDEKA